MSKTILISGGNGLLAKELDRINTTFIIHCPTHQEMDVSKLEDVHFAMTVYEPDVFLHAAAMTIPMDLHDQQPERSIRNNIIGTANVATTCWEESIPLVYISTDYVYPGKQGPYSETDDLNPINLYAWSKLGGEAAAQMVDSLILRCSFTARPFKHDRAFTDSYKSYLYVDEIAPIILELIERDCRGVYNVGGHRRSVYQFASESRDVKEITRSDIGDWVPKDTSMDITKLRAILNEDSNRPDQLS